MARFESPQVSFEVPDDWVDQTVAAWVEPDGPEIPASVSLTRDFSPTTDTLEGRADAVLRSLKARLPEVNLFERTGVVLGGTVPAVQLLLEWAHARGKVTQLVTLFLRDGTFWSFTASVPSARLEELEPIMQQVLGSLAIEPPAT